MKRIAFVVLAAASFNAYCAELVEGNTYRSKVDLEFTLSTDAGATEYSAGENSKFDILDSSGAEHYLIRVKKLYKLDSDKSKKGESTINYVDFGKRYYIKKTINNSPVEKLVIKSFSGVVSGPLVVPFKYRTGDKSFSGETTIGYYAGWGIDIWRTGVGITPMLSAGLTQVSVANSTGDGTENKSGFTWAAGFLLRNWDNMNVGLVYGEDRIGDPSWEHEGDGWWSISMGWEI